MKNLKFLFLTLFSVISLSVFSQTQVIITNTSGPNICDGTATLDTTNVDTTSIFWMGMGAILSQGSYTVTNLCEGTYYVTFISNGTSTALTFNIGTNPCNGFSAQMSVTQSQDSVSCNGTAVCLVNGGIIPSNYNWSSGTNIGNYNTSNLCPGPVCCIVTDTINGCTITVCDTITVVPPPVYGDTLIINGNSCMTPQDSLFATIELCSFDYNAVDSAFISFIQDPSSPSDPNMAPNWMFVDSLGQTVLYLQSLFPAVTVDGCYDFTLTIFCTQKSLNIKTIIVHDARAVFVTSGLNEITQTEKTLVKVIDIMGKVTKLETNKLLIKCYDDGTTEKVYINE